MSIPCSFQRSIVRATIVACGCTSLWTCVATGQGRGGPDWTTANGDAQRTSWVRSDARITRESLQSGDFRLMWKVKLDNDPRQLNSLSQTVVFGATYGAYTISPIVMVAGSSDNVYGLDGDLGRIFWKKHLSPAMNVPATPGSLTCPGGLTAGLTRPTVLAPAVAAAGRAGGRGRGGIPVGGAVGAPDAGAPNLVPANTPAGVQSEAQAVVGVAPPAPAGRGAAAAGPGAAPGAGGGGRSAVNSVYAISGDGYVHSLNVQNGAESAPAVPFLRADGNASGLILINNVLYASTSQDCGGIANGLWAMNLGAPDKTVTTWKSHDGATTAVAGPAFGADGTIFLTVASDSGAVVALDPVTLKMKDSYSPAKTNFDSTPVVFRYKDKDLVVVSSRDGRLHLLDAASLGGVDHQTPICKTAVFSNSGESSALTGYEDSSGTRWVLAAARELIPGSSNSNGNVTHGAIVAFKLVEQNGQPVLQQAWVSRDMISPLPSMVINGMVFALSGGEYRTRDASIPIAQRVQRSSPAVLYALDPATGREIWSSGSTITSFVHSGGLSASPGAVYVGAYDATLYAFGFPLVR